MKTNIISLCARADFKKILESKGYTYFDKGFYNLNIIGVRNDDSNLVSNDFDDVLVVIYNTEERGVVKRVFSVTTKPGLKTMKTPVTAKGTAILVPGQYRGCWKIGMHKGKYKALVQNKAVKVYRDNNRDKMFDLKPETIENGVFGINIHKAGTHSTMVDNWSAGCTVFQNEFDFKNFMRLCQMQIANKKGEQFTYTLINKSDLI